MDYERMLAAADHTLLRPEATWEQIRTLIDEAIEYKTASVCIPPSYVKQAKDYAEDAVKICTVIGFPNGYNATAVKVFETLDAIAAGADEIDMVINIGWVKDREWNRIRGELSKMRKACDEVVLKVIIETCLLTDEEKIKLCSLVTEAGADYIKTSTGFSTGGATAYDVELLKKNVGEGIKVKAAGGITSLADAEKFLELGADRLGTSKVVKLIKEIKED
ncbi:MAG: deoxyribose-phosphate aldolase [Eubacterium sp.]|nr:deoxyribose-phosphate aldolase [Eubacterium sp.]